MTITSNLFILFVAISVILYYLVPRKAQWILLLLVSYAYYLAASVRAVIFLLLSTVITWAAARIMQKNNDEIKSKKEAKAANHKYLLLALCLNLGILAVLKYTNFVLENINGIFHSNISMLSLILPLGISYYTFQTVGYMLDVYWRRTKAESNLFRYALFVSFFPQLVQGPIGRYGKLAPQFAAEHRFSYRRIQFGLERIVWGLFKKMIIADWAAVYRAAIFEDPDKYAGIAIFGVLLYSAELYGDFTGGIDVMIGVASLFGIELDENFQRPFFAISITDFWHRWHITLGTWMKDYVFYPLALSKGMNKLGKSLKKKLGKKVGQTIPVALCNLLVFFLVGIWHGANWNNIGWGLYNGIIIALSNLLADVYVLWKNKLHINDNSKPWHLFMVLRTFIIINISWYFDCADSFAKAWKMIVYSVTRFQPSQFLEISSGKLGQAYTPYALLTLGIGLVILFIVSLIQERGVKIREALAAKPLCLSLVIFLLLLISIPLFGPMGAARGFIYAQF